MARLIYLVATLLLLPAVVFSATTSDRSFADPLSPASLSLDMVVDNYDEDINCGGLGFWGVQAIEHVTGNMISGFPRFVSSENLAQTFTLDLPEGDYEELTFVCSDDGENEAFQFGSIENNLAGDQIIFTASEAPILVLAPPKEEVSLLETVLELYESTVAALVVPITTVEEPALVAVEPETIIVSDTNEPSITAPMPNEGEPVGEPEPEIPVSSISAEPTEDEVVTLPF